MESIPWVSNRERPRMRFDSFYRFSCVIVGVQMDSDSRWWIRYILPTVWFFTITCGVFAYAKDLGDVISGAKIRGISYFTNIVGNIFYSVIPYLTLIHLLGVDLGDPLLINKYGRNLREFVVCIICPWSYFLVDVRDAIESTNILDYLQLINVTILDAILSSYFIILNDVLLNLQALYERILTLTADIGSHPQNILDEKWKFRMRVKRANKLP